MLLDGINHIACISHDPDRLGRFYAEVFEAEIGPTRPHGEHGEETMTVEARGRRTWSEVQRRWAALPPVDAERWYAERAAADELFGGDDIEGA